MTQALVYFFVSLIAAIASAPLQAPYLADLFGFIGIIGLILLVFKDTPDDPSAEEQIQLKRRKIWLGIFAVNVLLAMVYGTFANPTFVGAA